MGNTNAKPHPKPRNKKQVHWKAAGKRKICYLTIIKYFFEISQAQLNVQ